MPDTIRVLVEQNLPCAGINGQGGELRSSQSKRSGGDSKGEDQQS